MKERPNADGLAGGLWSWERMAQSLRTVGHCGWDGWTAGTVVRWSVVGWLVGQVV